MKKAIINKESKRINRVKDDDFAVIPEGREMISITNAQAAQFESSSEPLFYIDNQLKTFDQKLWIDSPDSVKNNIRFNRNKLLADSDWTQLPDSPLSTSVKAQWATYRQTLRDLTDNVDSNGQVTFPTEPSS
jgi:hypothetical protein